MDFEDIYCLFELLDNEPLETPTFVTAKLSKVLSIDSSEVGVYKLVSNVLEVKKQVSDRQALGQHDMHSNQPTVGEEHVVCDVLIVTLSTHSHWVTRCRQL